MRARGVALLLVAPLLLAFASAAHAEGAIEGEGFRFVPPDGFARVDDAAFEEEMRTRIVKANAEKLAAGAAGQVRVWAFDRTEEPGGLLLLISIPSKQPPVDHPAYLEGEQAAADRLATQYGDTPRAVVTRALAGGVPYIQVAVAGHFEGEPMGMRTAGIPRRDFVLMLSFEAPPSDDGDALWAAVLGGLEVSAPPPERRGWSKKAAEGLVWFVQLVVAGGVILGIIIWQRRQRARGKPENDDQEESART